MTQVQKDAVVKRLVDAGMTLIKAIQLVNETYK